MKKVILFLFSILIATTFLVAENDVKNAFNVANENYQKGDFKTAIQQYSQLLESGFQSPELHYNLGNAYFRTNDMGHSILHLEKAALLDPRNQDILYNLKVVKNKLPDQIEVVSEFFVSRWWNGLQTYLGPTSWAILGLLLLWAGIGGLVIWFRGNNRKHRKKGFVLGLSLLVLCILPFCLGFSASKKRVDSKRAVIMIDKISLKSAPDEVSEDVLELHAGTSLLILDKIGSWKKVRLSNGEEGWLESKVLESI